MKKNIILALGLLSFVGCTNEDEIFRIDPQAFVLKGQWKLKVMIVETPIDIDMDGTKNTDLFLESDCMDNELIQFDENNSGKIISTSHLEIVVNPDFPEDATVLGECMEEETTTNFSYVKNTDNVTITYSGGVMTGVRQEDYTLKFTITNGQKYYDDEQDVVSTEDLVLIYEKVN